MKSGLACGEEIALAGRCGRRTHKVDEREKIRQHNANEHGVQRLAILDFRDPRREWKAAVPVDKESLHQASKEELRPRDGVRVSYLANAQHCLEVAAMALHVPKKPRTISIVATMPVAALLPVAW